MAASPSGSTALILRDAPAGLNDWRDPNRPIAASDWTLVREATFTKRNAVRRKGSASSRITTVKWHDDAEESFDDWTAWLEAECVAASQTRRRRTLPDGHPGPASRCGRDAGRLVCRSRPSGPTGSAVRACAGPSSNTSSATSGRGGGDRSRCGSVKSSSSGSSVQGSGRAGDSLFGGHRPLGTDHRPCIDSGDRHKSAPMRYGPAAEFGRAVLGHRAAITGEANRGQALEGAVEFWIGPRQGGGQERVAGPRSDGDTSKYDFNDRRRRLARGLGVRPLDLQPEQACPSRIDGRARPDPRGVDDHFRGDDRDRFRRATYGRTPTPRNGFAIARWRLFLKPSPSDAPVRASRPRAAGC